MVLPGGVVVSPTTLHRLLLFAELAGLGRYTTRGLGIFTLDSGAGRIEVVIGTRNPRGLHTALTSANNTVQTYREAPQRGPEGGLCNDGTTSQVGGMRNG